MKNLLLLSMVLAAITSQVSFASNVQGCRMQYPDEAESFELKILSDKFELVSEGPFDFKLSRNLYDATVVLRKSDGVFITKTRGRSDNSVERSLKRALKKLPTCSNGSLKF
jgi:hypothetical protein